MNPRSIRFRLAGWNALFFGGVFVVLAALLFIEVRGYLETTLLETQTRRARQIAETLVVRLPETGEPYIARQIQALYAPELGNRFIRVSRPDGGILYCSGLPLDHNFDPAEVSAVNPGKFSPATRLEKFADGRGLFISAFRILATDGKTYTVEVGTSDEPVSQLVRRLVFLLAIGLPFVALVALGSGYLLVRRALAPVDDIAGKAEIITQHNLSERLPVPQTGDELERLSRALNRMISRLDDAFGHSRRFVADASHEMRTPLTIIQGELEALAQDSRNASAFRESLGSVLEEVERLAKIVQQLFALSRLDAGEAQAESVRFDLSELAASTVAQMGLLAEDKRIALTCDITEPIFVNGDRSRLTQVIVNLLDNAIKYTDSGGAVQLRTAKKDGFALLEVADTGKGIPAEAIPHVFDRFFRVRQNSEASDGGAGLGLAIVESICCAHGGRVEVESAVGRGSRFRVSLPLSTASASLQE